MNTVRINNSIIFAFPGHKKLTHSLAKKLQVEKGELIIKRFPDGESYVRINSAVKDKIVILFYSLANPDSKILSLMFTAQTLKALGAQKVILISPYLPYMRQDARFKPGEAITSQIFAQYLSSWVDYLVTIDPHLHRVHHLSNIYSIPVKTLHATQEIALWIKQNIKRPFLIGPDSESRQWVSEIAKQLNAPYIVCTKNRLSDKEVKIDIPSFLIHNETLIIMDDIISTGSSMLAILKQLAILGQHAICLAVHPLFNNKTKNHLLASGATDIITCNTVSNSTNKINMLDLIAVNIEKIIAVI